MPSLGLRHVIFSSDPWKIKILKLIDFLLGTLLAWSAPRKKHPRDLPSSPSKILIIRPGGMGDAIFFLPVLKTLRAAHPQLIIDILCEKKE